MLTIGADPELFVKEDNKFVSAHGLVKGTKEAPQPVEKGAVQVDGMALEFNIDPATDEAGFVLNVNEVLRQLRGMVPENMSFTFAPVAQFGKEYIAQQPIEAQMLGCSPDYNAYTGEENFIPNPELPFRTAAGHVHVGWGEGFTSHFEECRERVKQLDYFLGVPSVFIDRNKKRREMYGKAGAFRPKPYGLEYRVLSNFWLRNDTLKAWVYRNTKLAMTFFDKGKLMSDKHGDLALHIINSSDKKTAKNLLKEYKELLPKGYTL